MTVRSFVVARRSDIAGLVAALVGLLYMMRPTLEIRFGLIDDHEILDIIGRRDRLPVSEIPRVIIERSDEGIARFRPVYWVGRVLESATAGQNPHLWYLGRLALAMVVLVCIYFVVSRFAHPAIAAIVSLLPFVGPQFETWHRLGPAESYAIALFCIGLALLVRAWFRNVKPARLWPAYLLLTAAALGKENFVVVTTVIILWTVVRHGIRKLDRNDWVVAGVALAVNVADMAVLYLLQQQYGSIYPQPRTLQTIRDAYRFFIAGQNPALELATAVLVGAMLLLAIGGASMTRRVLELTALVALLAALQVYFYAGSPQVGRYLYPVMLASVFAWAVVGALCAKVAGRWRRSAATVAVVVFLLFPVSNGVRTARAAGEAAAITSIRFNTQLSKIEDQAEKAGVDAVVMQPSNPGTDIEPVLSVARFLHARNDLRVMTLPATNAPPDPFSQSLAKQLTDWSEHGHSALKPFRHTRSCLAIVFGPNRPVCPVSAGPPY